LNKWREIVEEALHGTGQGPFYDPEVFNLGMADTMRYQIFANARGGIGKALANYAKDPTTPMPADFKARAAQLVEDVLNGATVGYSGEQRRAAKVEFLTVGFTTPSVAIKNLLLQTPQFEEYRKDVFSKDLGL
jgi:hypothetical protein